MGMGASKNEKTIAAILEKLNKKNNKKYEVLNAACGGYCSWHSVIKLSMELIRLKPDTVIEISGWNDMMHSSWEIKKMVIGLRIMIDPLKMLLRQYYLFRVS